MDDLLEWMRTAFVERFRTMTTGDFDAYLNLRSRASVEWRALQMGFGALVTGLAWTAIGLPSADTLDVSPAVAWGFTVFALVFGVGCWFGSAEDHLLVGRLLARARRAGRRHPGRRPG